jgi:hypothetical protein
MIAQRFEYDCSVCCLAMFLGVDYETIARHCSGAEMVMYGLTDHREQHIAGLFGATLVFRDRELIDRARPAVLTVPSLNSGRGVSTHALYWDGKRVHDPNQHRKGKRAYTNQAAWEVCTDGYQLGAEMGESTA